MSFENFELTTRIGDKIQGHCWKTTKELLGSVIISHGMAEHGQRYDYFASFLNEHGYNVYCLDQIGHGVTANEKLGVWPKDGFRLCISNLQELVSNIMLTLKPIILIGHSMGSFVAQKYFSKYSSSINGLVLIGSSAHQVIFTAGAKLTNFSSHFISQKHQEKPSKFYNGLLHFVYNIGFSKKECSSKNRWISTNIENVAAYDADPLSGFNSSFTYFREFFNGTAKLHKRKILESIENKIPVLLLSGKNDPVSQRGRGVIRLKKFYNKISLKAEVIIYPKMRHEILNETGKEVVYADILAFMTKIVD